MSGGSLDYFYNDLESHAVDFDDMELNDLVKDLAKLFYAREWYLSGDTCEGKWREARDAFKKKWFSENTRKDRLEEYMKTMYEKMLDSLGLSEAYCKNCEYWTPENIADGEYGDCDMVHGCLMHRSEKCDRFKKKLTA